MKSLQYKFGPKVLLNLGNILLTEEDFPGAETDLPGTSQGL